MISWYFTSRPLVNKLFAQPPTLFLLHPRGQKAHSPLPMNQQQGAPPSGQPGPGVSYVSSSRDIAMEYLCAGAIVLHFESH
jgi:hypothetical protein